MKRHTFKFVFGLVYIVLATTAVAVSRPGWTILQQDTEGVEGMAMDVYMVASDPHGEENIVP